MGKSQEKNVLIHVTRNFVCYVGNLLTRAPPRKSVLRTEVTRSEGVDYLSLVIEPTRDSEREARAKRVSSRLDKRARSGEGGTDTRDRVELPLTCNAVVSLCS